MAVRILAVDDEPDLEALLRQKFRRQIREGAFDMDFAENGRAALSRLESQPDTDIVLTDINMPEMDGLTLLGHIREVNPIIKPVIISAYGDMHNIRTAMNRGAYDFLTKPIDFDDLEVTIAKTVEQVNATRASLQAIRENDILRMYVDDNVIGFMAGDRAAGTVMVSEVIEATVMFVDLCGFTAVAERLAPADVVAGLNAHLDAIVRRVIEHGGRVDKFLGDGVMAVFTNEHHLDRALECALDVRAALAEEPDEAFPGHVSIGIDSGSVVSGNIGSESLARLDYTVVGDVVNTAARYQSVAGEGRIVIGEPVFRQVQSAFRCERIGEVALKNKRVPAVIYNVLA